jgi:hypothetical protein
MSLSIDLSLRRIVFSALGLLIFCGSCKISYVSFRPEQSLLHPDSDQVVRLYIDRYGDFYPKTSVPIDSTIFKLNGKSDNPVLGSLSHYFLSDTAHLTLLKHAYGIGPEYAGEAAYREVQHRILQAYVEEVKRKALNQHASRVVFLVHGFNDVTAENEYEQMRDLIAARHYGADRTPVYVDVHWDGLNAHAFDGKPVVRVWGPALLDSRYVSITLRNLMVGVEHSTTPAIPSVMITHSLGGGVAMGAVFNTTSKWEGLNMFVSPENKERLSKLIEAPTPTSTIRLGMLVPATPGKETFIDFNKREPSPIDRGNNHIEKIVIGYNKLDYAVGKILLGKLRLAPIYGSTNLGCDYEDIFGADELSKVFTEMDKLGYGAHSKIIAPIEFKTPLRKGKPGREHLWPFYMKLDTINELLDQLFN